jgi:hypothetical protein
VEADEEEEELLDSLVGRISRQLWSWVLVGAVDVMDSIWSLVPLEDYLL